MMEQVVVKSLLGIALRRQVRKAAEEVCDYLEKVSQKQLLELARKDTKILSSQEAVEEIRKKVKKAYAIAKNRGVAEYVLKVMSVADPKLMIRLIAEEAMNRAEEGNPKAWKNLQYISHNQTTRKWLAKQILEMKSFIINEWQRLMRENP